LTNTLVDSISISNNDRRKSLDKYSLPLKPISRLLGRQSSKLSEILATN